MSQLIELADNTVTHNGMYDFILTIDDYTVLVLAVVVVVVVSKGLPFLDDESERITRVGVRYLSCVECVDEQERGICMMETK